MAFPHTWVDGSGQAIDAAALTEIENAILALRPSALRPAAIASTRDNYAPGAAGTIYLTTDGSGNKIITGIVAGLVDGETRSFINSGTDDITFNHQDTNSTAANRFVCPLGVNFTIAAGELAAGIYDGTLARWRLF